MTDFIPLTCPSCGGKLEITEDIQQFACAHCGIEYLINRSTSVISLTPLVREIRKVQSGVDKTASELAIMRLKKEITFLENEFEEDIPNQKWYIQIIIVWGMGIFSGLLLSVIGIQLSSYLLIVLGVIIAGYAIFKVYKYYNEYVVLKKKIHNNLAETRRKNKELAKHEAIVRG